MCGLVGIAGNLLYQDEFTMKRLLLSDYFRGPDSTGMAAIRSNNDVVAAKLASNPIDLFNLAQFKAALNGTASRAFIGHNRMATRGGVCTANAHPFQVDHIVGAHNGTLDFESFRRLKDKLNEDFSVDSLALITGFARIGVKETMKLCSESKDGRDGAWAITWFDQNDGTLNFLKNRHRSLYYCYEEGFKRLFWASEWWMLREAMSASPNGYKLYTEEDEKQVTGYFSFDDNVHYKFDLEMLCKGGKSRPKPKVTKVPCREPEVSTVTPFGEGWQHDHHRGWFRPARKESGTHSGSATKTRSTSQNSTSKLSTVVLEGNPLHPYANIVKEERFAQMSHSGCAWCQKPVKFGEPGVSMFEDDGHLLCRYCTGYSDDVENPPVKIYVPGNVIDALS